MSWGFIIPHSSVMRRRKTDVRERKRAQNRGGEEEKKEAFDRAVWRPCVNEPVKGSHCLAATSIWYCTFLFLLHCLLSQCLLSPPLYSLSLSLKEIGGLRPAERDCVSRLSTIVTLCREDREGILGSVSARLRSLSQRVTALEFFCFVLFFKPG